MLSLTVAVAVAAFLVQLALLSEVVKFTPKAEQEAIVRDGQSVLVSRKANSIVIARPATRKFTSGDRPVFALAIYNLSRAPIDFRVANIEAVQMLNGAPARLQVVPYEQLVSEEETRQTIRKFGAGLASPATPFQLTRATEVFSRPHTRLVATRTRQQVAFTILTLLQRLKLALRLRTRLWSPIPSKQASATSPLLSEALSKTTRYFPASGMVASFTFSRLYWIHRVDQSAIRWPCLWAMISTKSISFSRPRANASRSRVDVLAAYMRSPGKRLACFTQAASRASSSSSSSRMSR